METNRGYFKLSFKDTFLHLHFSQQCWYNLWKDAGINLEDLPEILNEAGDSARGWVMIDIIHAAHKAYNQKHGSKSQATVYEMREEANEFNVEEIAEMWKVMEESGNPKEDDNYGVKRGKKGKKADTAGKQ